MNTYAKFTLHDFHSPTGFDKLQTNARLRERQSRSVIIKDAIWVNRRHPLNIWHVKYLELSAINNPAVNEFWLRNTSAVTYSQWESKIQGSGKFGEDFIIIIFSL